jgi:hypothetical protein
MSTEPEHPASRPPEDTERLTADREPAGPPPAGPPPAAPPPSPGPVTPTGAWPSRSIIVILVAAVLLVGLICGVAGVAVGIAVSHFGDRHGVNVQHDDRPYGPYRKHPDFGPVPPKRVPVTPTPAPSVSKTA